MYRVLLCSGLLLLIVPTNRRGICQMKRAQKRIMRFGFCLVLLFLKTEVLSKSHEKVQIQYCG